MSENSNNLSEEKKQMIEKIYQEFSDRIFSIEKERDEKIAKIIQGIDQRKIKQIMDKIKNI